MPSEDRGWIRRLMPYLIGNKLERDHEGRILGGELIKASEVPEEESNEVQFTNVENAKVESSQNVDTREKIHHTDSCSKFAGKGERGEGNFGCE